ncbi:MAG: carboxylesterase family protein, partial [Planctomycetota bacterium]
MLRSSLFICIALLAFSSGLSACSNTDRFVGQNVKVETADGPVEGRQVANGLYAFLGVPFAKPPTGELRWQAPLPRDPWTQIRSATSFAPACVQGGQTTEWYQGLIEDMGESPDLAARPVRESEDCLYLNVWTPSVAEGSDLPVMVWVHGGGYSGGWSYEPNYIGEDLARRDVVVVSIAYRLGPFGYIGPNDVNFGLKDQIKALEWVQENVQSFGGDPSNVTLFGESAGASSIGTLLVTPSAKGLFQRVIHQSAGFEFIEKTTLEDARKTYSRLALAANEQNVRDLSAEDLLILSRTDLPDQWFTPVSGDRILPRAPHEYIADDEVHAVDLIIGTNSDEWRMYIDEQSVDVQIEAWKQRFPGPLSLIENLISDHGKVGALDRIETAHQMRCPGRRLAQSVTKNGGSVYVYRFSRVRPSLPAKQIGSYHGAEIPYVFDTHDEWLPTNDVDRKLTHSMMSAWVAFAQTGNPNPALTWPEFGETNQLIEFG